VTGSAQNPLSLNRYLYALANPATLVDPDGHEVQNCVLQGGKLVCTSEIQNCVLQGGKLVCATEKQDKHFNNKNFNKKGKLNYKPPKTPSYGGARPSASDPRDDMTDDQILASIHNDFYNLDPTKTEDWPDLSVELATAGAAADYYDSVWWAAYWKTYFAMTAKNYSPLQAKQAAKNLADIKVGPNAGRFAGKISAGLSYIGMIYDGAKTIHDCKTFWTDCVTDAALAVGKDLVILRATSAVLSACQAGAWAGPEGCVAMSAAVGLTVSTYLNPDFWRARSDWVHVCDQENARIDAAGGWLMLDCSSSDGVYDPAK
jgi:hypothetical protein